LLRLCGEWQLFILIMANQYRGAKTYEQLQTKKDQAVRFVRNILGNEEKADFINSESVEEFAERKKIRIKNPGGKINMAKLENLKEAVIEAVAELDQADGSRTSMTAAIDSARSTLSDGYGLDFEGDLSEFLENEDNEESEDFDDPDDE
jgi:hypothetical protein